MTNYTLAAGTANAVSLSNVADAAVFTLSDDSLNNLRDASANGALVASLMQGARGAQIAMIEVDGWDSLSVSPHHSLVKIAVSRWRIRTFALLIEGASNCLT